MSYDKIQKHIVHLQRFAKRLNIDSNPEPENFTGLVIGADKSGNNLVLVYSDSGEERNDYFWRMKFSSDNDFKEAFALVTEYGYSILVDSFFIKQEDISFFRHFHDTTDPKIDAQIFCCTYHAQESKDGCVLFDNSENSGILFDPKEEWTPRGQKEINLPERSILFHTDGTFAGFTRSDGLWIKLTEETVRSLKRKTKKTFNKYFCINEMFNELNTDDIDLIANQLISGNLFLPSVFYEKIIANYSEEFAAEVADVTEKHPQLFLEFRKQAIKNYFLHRKDDLFHIAHIIVDKSNFANKKSFKEDLNKSFASLFLFHGICKKTGFECISKPFSYIMGSVLGGPAERYNFDELFLDLFGINNVNKENDRIVETAIRTLEEILGDWFQRIKEIICALWSKNKYLTDLQLKRITGFFNVDHPERASTIRRLASFVINIMEDPLLKGIDDLNRWLVGIFPPPDDNIYKVNLYQAHVLIGIVNCDRPNPKYNLNPWIFS